MKRPHPILWFRARPRLTDGLFAVLIAVPAGIASLSFETGEWLDRKLWWWTALVVASVLPIALRRVRPGTTLAIVVLAQMTTDLLDRWVVKDQPFALAHPDATASTAGWIGVLIASYSVAAHAAPRGRRFVAGCAAATVAAQLVTGLLEGEAAAELVFSGIAVAGVFAIGDNMRQRRERVAGLAERAERAEREQEMLARQRVTEERTRIAREMHDVVAHSVSMMTIQAAAARRQLHRNPDQAEAALTTIETTGRTAMDEMRRILGVLRTEGLEPRLGPQPSLAALPELLAADSELPLRAELAGDFDDIPASTQLAAFRLVQEALTNVRRHAGPVREVLVSTHRAGDHLTVEVLDDGRGASTSPNGHGFGLVGMRERVAIANGTLEAGPRSGGGWRVAASFKLSGARS